VTALQDKKRKNNFNMKFEMMIEAMEEQENMDRLPEI